MISYTPKDGAKPMVGKPPAGRYVVEIKEMHSKRAKNDSCDTLSFKFEVIDGEYKGKVMWSRLNLNHTNGDNQWAEDKIDSLCYALKIPEWNEHNYKALCYNKPILLDVYMGKEFNGKTPYEMSHFEQVSQGRPAPLPPQQPAPPAQQQQQQQPPQQQVMNTNTAVPASMGWTPPSA